MNSERLQEIKEEFENLLDEAKRIVQLCATKHEYERAKAYWINPIEWALENQRGGQGSMEETIESINARENETEEQEDTLEIIEQVALDIGGTVKYNYSGRGMFGKKCVGIICSNVVECVELAAQKGVLGASTDNMGLDYIVYWEKVQCV